MNKTELPDWLSRTEEYTPETDRDGFMTRSMLKLMSVLNKARQSTYGETRGASAVVRLVYTLLFIILVSASHNMFFTYIMLAGALVRFAVLPQKQLGAVVRGALTAAVISMIILLPAVFLGQPKTMLTVSLKVFFSVGILNVLALATPWNKLTEGLRFFHVPDVFIFTLDTTLKYIVVLGGICVNMLEALKLRTVGRNHNKKSSFSGILGVTFLKSQEMAEEMNEAMICRVFCGEYPRTTRGVLKKTDLLYLLLMAAVIALFIYFERMV